MDDEDSSFQDICFFSTDSNSLSNSYMNTESDFISPFSFTLGNYPVIHYGKYQDDNCYDENIPTSPQIVQEEEKPILSYSKNQNTRLKTKKKRIKNSPMFTPFSSFQSIEVTVKDIRSFLSK